MKEQTTKERIRALVDELVAVKQGTVSQGRLKTAIMRDLHELGTSSEGKAAGYSRPFASDPDWSAFSVNGPSEVERERKRLISMGLATPTKKDLQDADKDRQAAERSEKDNEAKRVRWASQEAEWNRQHTPITRKSLVG